MLEQDFILIGISGKKGVGKNYVSEKYIIPLFIQKYNEKDSSKHLIPYFFSFGSTIKAELFARHKDLSSSDLLSDHKTYAIRKLLQEYGTEQGRDGHHKDIWIRQVSFWMETQIRSLKQSGLHFDFIPLFIIQDVRFKNEFEFVSGFSNSLIIRIVSEQRHAEKCELENNKSNDNHISETELDDTIFQFYIFNDYVHDIKQQSTQIVDYYLESFFL